MSHCVRAFILLNYFHDPLLFQHIMFNCLKQWFASIWNAISMGG